MKLLLYNIAYGTGAPQNSYRRLWTIHRYIKTRKSHLDRIIEFIQKLEADIVGLVEVDMGSYRTDFINQAELIAVHLKHYHYCANKYGKRSLGRALPIMNKQANAVLARNKIPLKEFHFFPFGVKKLIIEIEAYGIRLYLVHLALQKSVRKKQLEYLASLVKKDGPTIIAGDFNTFSGASELVEFKKKLGLYNPNRRNHPTYPSWHPAKQLDFMLCSKEIRTKNFTVYDVKYSDHLPLLLDFEIT